MTDYDDGDLPTRWILPVVGLVLGISLVLIGGVLSDGANDRADHYEQKTRELNLCAAVAQSSEAWLDCRDEVLR